MTRAMAVELAPSNVQVNAVGPTITVTEGRAGLLQDPAFVAETLPKIPAGRFCTPADVVGAIVFLASRSSDMVTGQLLLVDGGWTAE